MIDDVQNGNADFEAILVYDVSRWGRFQDTDESRLLRVPVQASRDRRPLLCRAVRERRRPGRHDHQERQAGDGGRVQPGAVLQGLQGPVQAHRAGLPPGRAGGIRPAADADRPHAQGKGHSGPGREEEPANRSGHPGARPRRRGPHRAVDLPDVHPERAARNAKSPRSSTPGAS